jgi:hypothetical protein
MNAEDIHREYGQAKSIPRIFEAVKKAVQLVLGKSRSGLMLGLADLGEGAYAWIGGYHVLASNAIVMNRRPMDYVKEHHPKLFKPYVFMILLHEYIHTLGFHNEAICREKTIQVTRAIFGDNIIAMMAKDMSRFLPYLRQMKWGWHPPEDQSIYYLVGFDESSVEYII